MPRRPSDLTPEDVRREAAEIEGDLLDADERDGWLFGQQELIREAEEQGRSDDDIVAAIQSGTLDQLVNDGSRDLTDPFVVEIETDAAEDDGC